VPLSQTVLNSQRSAIRTFLIWFSKHEPLLSPEEQKAEIAHFVEDLKARDEALAQLEARAAEYDARSPSSPSKSG
jgi:hypothetical protein